jgi:hypothetical protein
MPDGKEWRIDSVTIDITQSYWYDDRELKR